jgi:RHS repeat-associated protein
VQPITTSFGFQYAHGWNWSESLTALVDIDGDGLEDIVGKDLKSGVLYYKKHIVTRTYDKNNTPIVSHSFLPSQQLIGLSNFFCQKGQSSSPDFQLTFGITPITVFAGFDWTNSKSETNIYFTDANNDGLMDIVKNGTVFFNHLVNGIPTFEADSKNTENMVITASPKEINTPAEYLNDTVTYPNMDVVKMWEAPADGKIKIENNISLTNLSDSAEVTIEMKVSQGNCFTVDFPMPTVQKTVYNYWYATGAMDNFNYGWGNHPLPGTPVSIKMTSMNNISPTEPLWVSNYNEEMGCDLIMPNNFPYCLSYYLPGCPNPIIQYSKFDEKAVKFIHDANIQYHLFNINVDNISGVFSEDPPDNSDSLEYLAYNVSFKSLTNVGNTLPIHTFWDSCPDSSFWGKFTWTTYPSVGSDNEMVGITTNITITTSASTQNYGPYNLSDQYERNLFQNDLQVQFPGATVSDINGTGIILIPSTADTVISILLTGGGIQNTYNFANCAKSNLAIRSSDWDNVQVDQKDVELSNIKSVAEGHELTLPINEVPINFYLCYNDKGVINMTNRVFNVSISKDTIIWITNNDTIHDKLTIDNLNKHIKYNNNTYNTYFQQYRQATLNKRINDRYKAIKELETYHREKLSGVKKQSPKLESPISTCTYQPGNLCLLYGTILNNAHPSVNNVVRKFSMTCNQSQDSLTVSKGDRIYFRVHHMVNGNTPVTWNPKIEYTDPTFNSIVDQNGLKPFNNSYSDGFIISAPLGVIYPGNGTATISWDSIIVDHPSDSITYEIKRMIFQGINETPQSEDVIFSKTCPPGQTTTVSSSGIAPISVTGYNKHSNTSLITEFDFSARATSNVNWKTVEWKPKMICVSTPDTLIGKDSTAENTIVASQTKYPIVDYSIYKSYFCSEPYNLYNIPSNNGTSFTIVPSIDGLFSSNDNGVLYFVIKGNHTLIGAKTVIISNGAVTYSPLAPIAIPDTIRTIEIGYYSDDLKLSVGKTSLLKKIAFSGNPVALIYNSLMTEFPVGKQNVNLFQKPWGIFGSMYRQWGQFMYDPAVVTGATPIGNLPGNFIKEESLQFTPAQDSAVVSATNGIGTAPYDFQNYDITDTSQFNSFTTNFNHFKSNNGSLSKIALIPALPLRNYSDSMYIEKWYGLYDQCFANDTSSCAAGFTEAFSGFTNADDETVQGVINTGAYSISKYSKGNGNNFSAGVSIGLVGMSYSRSFNDNNKSLSEYIDLNGDGYPDILTTDEMQITNRTGGLYDKITHNSNYTGDISTTPNDSWGLGASGTFPVGGNSTSGQNYGSYFSFKNFMRSKPITNVPHGNAIGVSLNYNHSKDETTRLWADINGDGLNDLLIKSGDSVLVLLNYGNNTFLADQQAKWGSFNLSKSSSNSLGGGGGASFNFAATSIEAGISYGVNLNSQEYSLQDVNGDGLMDIIHSTSDGIKVRINYGSRFSDEILYSDFNFDNSAGTVTESLNAGFTYGFTLPFLVSCVKFPVIGANGQAAVSTNSSKKLIVDFDGDGFPDIMEEIAPTVYRIEYSNIRRTNKLKSVTNPLGGKFTLDYQVVPKSYNNPQAKWVMSEVITDDGYKLINDSNDVYMKDFLYENGKYDRREREFYGFETVKTIDYKINPDSTKGDAYRTSITKYYNNNYYLKGEVKETFVCKGSDTTNLFSKQENVYVLKGLTNNNYEIDTSSNLPLTFDVGGTEGRRTAAPLLKHSISKLYELGSTPMASITSMDYDSKGRVVTVTNYGDITTTNDDYITSITYYSNSSLTNKNIIDIPHSIVVKDINNNVLRSRSTDNINNTTGAIGRIIAVIDDNTNAVTDMTYDTYGNLNSITLPENINGERMSYSYTYDVTDVKYINAITDAKNYSSSSCYDARFDEIVITKDITQLDMIYQYDDLGRLVKVIGPNEQPNGNNAFTIKFEYYPTFSSIQNSPYQGCVTKANFMPVAITRHYDPQHPDTTIDTYTFMDGLARPVQIKKNIELNSNSDPHSPPTYFDAMSVSGKVCYDSYGRVIKKFNPTWEIKGCSTNMVVNTSSVQYASNILIDELDRPIKTMDQEGNITNIDYSVSSNLSKTHSVTDQNGTQSVISEIYKDVRGNVVKTNNVGPNGDIITSFVFDPISELLSYTDDDGLSTSYTYDRLGHKLTFNHPDNGLTTYTYDEAGNILTLQTANLAGDGTSITYGYDYNKLVNIIYPLTDGNTNVSNTNFTYGLPNTGNSTGRLTHQTDATGTQDFEYDKMGNVSHNTRVVVPPSNSLPTQTFETYYTYDSWDRLLSISYPDHEIVNYFYDHGGNVNKITGDLNGTPYNYLDRADYDYYEQRTYVKYGNGSENIYSYTPELHRLNNLTEKSSSTDVLGNNTYTYDKVGNITSLVNTAVPAKYNGMGGSSEHIFTYDVLNRLITGTGGFLGDRKSQQPLGNDYSSTYILSMAYSNTGRITTKTQLHNKNGVNNPDNTYTNQYSYGNTNHEVSNILNLQDPLTPAENFTYDLNGNLVEHDKGNDIAKIYWDEENRMRVISTDGIMQHYLYDASGERIMKARSLSTAVYVNGTLVDNNITMDNYTTYPSGLIVVDPNGIYSKHYYIGTQRIASRIGDGTAVIFEGKSKDMPDLRRLQQNDMMHYFAKEGVKSIQFAKRQVPDLKVMLEDTVDHSINGAGNGAVNPPKSQICIYFYHPDHLGTNTIVTDMVGNTYQYFLNLPFGETMAEQLGKGYFQSHYKFNGKELDAETGLYYYGARYYDPKTSVWLSVDPLSNKYPAYSPYLYCTDNPSNFIDPDGMDVDQDAPGYQRAKNAATPIYDEKGRQINKLYQPKFAKLFKKYEEDHTINVKFDDSNILNKSGFNEGGTVKYEGTDNGGTNASQRDVYGVYWDPSISEQLGTSGMFEETYHLEDALNGGWEIKGNRNFTNENEARAKMWVVNNINNIEVKYFDKNGVSQYTHFGYISQHKNFTLSQLIDKLINGVRLQGMDKYNRIEDYNVFGFGGYKK